jgi:hypothetical protein
MISVGLNVGVLQSPYTLMLASTEVVAFRTEDVVVGGSVVTRAVVGGVVLVVEADRLADERPDELHAPMAISSAMLVRARIVGRLTEMRPDCGQSADDRQACRP